MKMQPILTFLGSSLFAAVFLALVPVDHTRVAWKRLDQKIQESGAIVALQKNCNRWVTRQPTRTESLFLAAYPLPTRDGLSECTLQIQSAAGSRFHLLHMESFQVRVSTVAGKSIFQQVFSIHYPTPLVFLPWIVFAVAIGFGWTASWIFFSGLAGFALLLEGGSVVATMKLAVNSTRLLWISDPTLPGVLMFVLWVSLYRSRERVPASKVRATDETPEVTSPPWRWVGQRVGTLLFGLWNPVAYTIAMRLVFPFQNMASRLKWLLDTQVLLFAFSVYLLSTTNDRFKDLRTSLLLPRYFTFALVLFLVLNWERLSNRASARALPAIWKMPFVRRSAFAVVVGEVASTQVPLLADCPTLVRVGIWLTASLVVTPQVIRWRQAFRTAMPTMGILLAVSLLGVMAQVQGLPDLASSMVNPHFHPIAAAFFTFLSGILLGISTGNFAAAFFPIAAGMVGSLESPLVRASLLDGVLVGYLFSPLSMLNQVTMLLFHFPPAELFRARWNQLKMPLLMGLVIYLVSAINSVAILRPVTFVFLCLVVVALHLRRENWNFDVFRRDNA